MPLVQTCPTYSPLELFLQAQEISLNCRKCHKSLTWDNCCSRISALKNIAFTIPVLFSFSLWTVALASFWKAGLFFQSVALTDPQHLNCTKVHTNFLLDAGLSSCARTSSIWRNKQTFVNGLHTDFPLPLSFRLFVCDRCCENALQNHSLWLINAAII